ncbi:MAG TPA: AbrB/MazE/SpoVT family DNA-binding domain-containing protein [Candidatus Deferrimicrobium sp.]|nr:AbrB/MazE/SpoVT family DNA-binding domain-containing protein [Candidatus Deferrimicrobium sp.]
MHHHHAGHGHGHGKCYGATVVGERGQVVIPVEAREELGIQPGEKLIVFGNRRRGMVILLKGDIMARFTEALMSKFQMVEKMFGDFGPNNKE